MIKGKGSTAADLAKHASESKRPRRVIFLLVLVLYVSVSFFWTTQQQLHVSIGMADLGRLWLDAPLPVDTDRTPGVNTTTARPSEATNTTLIVLDPVWNNRDIVHVIHTRFMQYQPHLVHLGLARLLLFRTFCLPTIIQQTSQDFLWIIRTDPNLNDTLREKLLQLILPHSKNIVLLASNDNPEGFRSHGMLKSVSNSSVWTHNYDLLQTHHVAAQTRLVLETRLDADDGLHVNFVEYLQRQSRHHLTASDQHDGGSWLIWCVGKSIEWHVLSPFDPNHHHEEVDEGYLVAANTQPICITPGLTMAYNAGVERDDMPPGMHLRLHTMLSECNDNDKGTTTRCLRYLEDLKPAAIRARTLTSAGMSHVVFGYDVGEYDVYQTSTRQAKLQQLIWNDTRKAFRIDMDEVKDTRRYLQSNISLTVQENLLGQCTKGHSCKDTSKEMLQQILNRTRYNTQLKR